MKPSNESPVPVEQQFGQQLDSLAKTIVETSAGVKPDDRVLLWYDPEAEPLIKRMEKLCEGIGAPTLRFVRNTSFDITRVQKEGLGVINSIFKEERHLIGQADNILIVRSANAESQLGRLPKNLYKAYMQAYAQTHQPRVDGSVKWTLFYWPTEQEATAEGMSYEDYFKAVIEACNQPWGKIKKSQQILIDKVLNPGKTLELIANPNDPDEYRRTHLTMSIHGMTFANSTVGNNVPGSEVFSAPKLNSVNGQLFAPGKYVYDGRVMKDIFLKIENGKITKALAAEGNKGLQEILNNGKGARFFGEVALGTNPGLIKRMVNDLLNEKVGGSFHMAIGHCYEFSEYGGVFVNVNNGNTSDKTPVHWDLTVQMNKQSGGGQVIVDGVTIQKDGLFIDPKLSILNPNFS